VRNARDGGLELDFVDIRATTPLKAGQVDDTPYGGGAGMVLRVDVVEELEEDGDLVYEITVAEDDLGRVIGKGGRIANAIRTIAKAAAVRIDRRVIVDILD